MIKACEHCKEDFFVKPCRYSVARFCSVKCRSKVVMGCYKFWEGKKRDKATAKKINDSWTPEKRSLLSDAYSGNKNPMYGKRSWNSGLKCAVLAGENNGCWKGDTASYAAKHIWMKNNFGKANKCEDQECLGVSKKYHWANISGEYKRNRSDWKMLCAKCHAKFDGRTKCKI